MTPGFVLDSPRFQVVGNTVVGRHNDIAFEGERRWWGGRWTLTSTAPFVVPEQVILFASRDGMDHGYWRDLRVGDARFDREYFIFCDTPALLPLILGPATRRALRAHDNERDALKLYVRGGTVQVIGTNHADDKRALDRHSAVHHALGLDHRACLEEWKDQMVTTSGRAEANWPPVGTIMSRIGTLLVGTSWTTPTSRESADWEQSQDSLRTHLAGHDDRKRRNWSVIEAPRGTAGTHELGGRHVTIYGVPSIALHVLGDLIDVGDIVAVRCSERISVSIRGLAGRRQFDAALRIVELIYDPTASKSPYR